MSRKQVHIVFTILLGIAGFTVGQQSIDTAQVKEFLKKMAVKTTKESK